MWVYLMTILLLFTEVLSENRGFEDIKMQQSDYTINFEWAELVKYNRRYLSHSELHTFKYNRTSSAINTSFSFKSGVGNEWELIIQGYKFASNEYRLFPLRFEVNMCTAVKKNYFGLATIRNCGNFSCPIKKGVYHYCNWAIDEWQFPPLIPNGKYMVEIQGFYHDEMQQSDYSINFEWAELISYNRRYLSHSELHTFKYNRSFAAMNTSFSFTSDIGTEWELVVQGFKFASNEYRLFPMRFEVNMCIAVKKNYGGLARIRNCGNFSCPIKKGIYHYCNWAIDESQFPPLIPNGKYMVEIQGLYRDEELYVQRYYGTISRELGRH